MKILAIDTATEACSAALLWDGQIYERFVEQPKVHGALILGMMDELLCHVDGKLQSLDALAFGRGPGAFTGTRIATAVAQAVGFSIGLSLVPISNLAVLAQGLYRRRGVSNIITALDARMQEVYIAMYEVQDGVARIVGNECLTRPDKFELIGSKSWHGVGRGWATYGDILQSHLGNQILTVTPEHLCQAQDMLPFAISAIKNGKVVTPENALPVYLRNQVTTKQPGI
ncbi:hypothetical protein TI03_04305 [Achromatium sp. WMS1]|nr:hypothetical protein TI03_04305 [Achromatium sp. WMS1]